jgi:hypothetical protein
MSTRISSAALACLSLAACHGAPSDNRAALAEVEANASADAVDDGRIVCAPQGSSAFSQQCTLDRSMTAQGLILTVHPPDGGFRRLLVKPGYGVVAADGAEVAKVTIVGANEIEVAIGGDRYRLPATVKGSSKGGK